MTAGPVEVPPTLGHKYGRPLIPATKAPRQSFTRRALAYGPPCPIFVARGRERVSGAFKTRPNELTAAQAAPIGKERPMKSLFHGAFLRGVSATVLAASLAACTANPQAMNRPGDVPAAFTAPVDKAAPIWPEASWWGKFGSDELAPLQATAQKENLDIAQAATLRNNGSTEGRHEWRSGSEVSRSRPPRRTR